MKKYILIFGIFCISWMNIYSQPFDQYGSIKGTIIDSLSGEPVFGAIISVIQNDTETGTITESNGGYLIDGIQPGICSVQVRCLGYQARLIDNVNIKAGVTTRLNAKIIYSDYDYEELAREEIQIGQVEIWVGGLILHVDTGVPDSAYNAIRNKYGFSIRYTGCDVTGVKEHNAVIETYLEKRNGTGWREKMNKELEEIEQQYKNIK